MLLVIAVPPPGAASSHWYDAVGLYSVVSIDLSGK